MKTLMEFLRLAEERVHSFVADAAAPQVSEVQVRSEGEVRGSSKREGKGKGPLDPLEIGVEMGFPGISLLF